MRRANLPKPVEWAIAGFVVTLLGTAALLIGSFFIWISYLLIINMRSW